MHGKQEKDIESLEVKTDPLLTASKETETSVQLQGTESDQQPE